MLPLFIYILKTILVTGILLGYYWIGLRNTRFHYYNRFYLVGTVLLSLFLPLLDLQWFTFTASSAQPVQQVVQYIYNAQTATQEQSALGWEQILAIGLFLVSAILVSFFLFGIFKVFLIKSKGKITVMEKFDFIEIELDEAPFSFFRNLFWRKDLPINDETGQRMLKHELTHIEQYHSFDKLIITLATYIFWINPFFWMIRKELEVVHEFIADEEAIAGGDAEILAEMLLKTHYHSTIFSVGQSFFYSSIKRRIIMLTSSKKVSYSYARRLLILPVAIGVLVLLSFTIKDSFSDAQNRQMDQSAIGASKLDTVPSKYRDAKTGKITGSFRIDIDGDMASFKDIKSKKELFKVPLSELSGPANKAIIVQGFPLNKEKKLTFISADGVHAGTNIVGTEVALQAPPQPPLSPIPLRIIINGEEFSPADLDKIDPSSIKTIDIRGRGTVDVQAIDKGDTTPIKIVQGYKLEKTSQVISITTADDNAASVFLKDPQTLTVTVNEADGGNKKTYTIIQKQTEKSEMPKDVLYIIDGKEMQSKSMKDIDPTTIKSINVLKGETAVKLYGEKGKSGVIEITTKK